MTVVSAVGAHGPDAIHQPVASTRQWLPGLEVLRGVAAVTVVFHHLWSLGTMPRFFGSWIIEGFGSWGVDIFFVLSSYLLIGQFLEPASRPRLRSYFVRRVFRIVPAYYASIVILFLFLAPHAQLFSAGGVRQLLGNLTFAFWWFPTLSSSLNVNGVYWTLSLEMCLYLAIPLVGFFLRRRPLLVGGALIAAGLGWKLVCARYPGAIRGWFFDGPAPPEGIVRIFMSRQFPGVLAVFAVGFLTRWLVERHPEVRGPFAWTNRHPIVAVVVLLAPTIVWLRTIETGLDFQHWRWFVVWDFVLALLAVPAIIGLSSITLTDRPGPMLRLGEWFGARSYGIYLWHFPIVLTVYGRGAEMLPPDTSSPHLKAALVLALAIGFGTASYHLIEVPAQEVGKRLATRARDQRRNRPAAP